MRIIIALFISLSFPLVSHAEKIFGHVIEVTSGDKLTLLDTSLATHKVRLIGIDAPESSQPYSKESQAKLFSLIHGKKVVVITNNRSHSNVLIGKVLLNKKDINLEQIKHGMAWTSYNYAKELSYVDQESYVNSQLQAKNKKLGLWHDSCPIEPWMYRQKCCPKYAKH